MKECQHLIGTIVIAVAIVVAAVIIAGAIDGAGESIRSSLYQLGDTFRYLPIRQEGHINRIQIRNRPLTCA